jgi:hypothetical protein
MRNDEIVLLPAFTANSRRWSSLTITAFCDPSPVPLPTPPVANDPAGVSEPSPPRPYKRTALPAGELVST